MQSLRRSILRVLDGLALCVLVVVLTPAWIVRWTIHAARSSKSVGGSVEIPRVPATEVDLGEVMAAGRPVVLEGFDELLHLPLRPDVDGLRRLAAEHPDRFRVASYKRHSPYFLYVGDYGAEFDHDSDMSLEEFLDFMFVDVPDPDLVTYKLFAVGDVDGSMGRVIDDIADRLGVLVDREPDRNASGIWVGSEGAVTPLHHDAWTGLLFQFEGSKAVVMYSPADRPNLYFTSPFAATDRWSTLPGRSGDADPAEFPLLERAIRHETTLHDGDVLFVPPYWAHEMEALEANISIPFRFATRQVDRLDPGFLRPAVEILHRRVVVPITS